MSKYEPLHKFLTQQTTAELPMTFGEVEQIIGSKLPASAYRHRPWWANEAASHVHAKAWLSADYQTEQVDMAGKKLVFKRVPFAHSRSASSSPAGLGEPHGGFKHEAGIPMPARHPMLGALKGWLVVEPNYDLTQPVMAEWTDLLDRKYGSERPK
jgi:hypothetical protein